MNGILVLKIAMPVLPASLSITCQTVIFVVSNPSCCYQQRLNSAMGAMAAKLSEMKRAIDIGRTSEVSPEMGIRRTLDCTI